MPRIVYTARPDDPLVTRTLGVQFTSGEPVEVDEQAAEALRGNPWFHEVTSPAADPLDTDGDGEVDRDELRAALDAAGIRYDRRWGEARLRAALEAG